MNNLTNIYKDVLQKGFDAAKLIIDQDKKALAYAELAKAIAATGLVENLEGVITETETKETKKTESKKTTANTKKDSLKADAGKGTEVKEEKEEVAPTPVEENTSTEAEVTDEWTEEMTTAKAEALGRLKQYTDAWTEDYVYNQCVPAFFEDKTVLGGDNIRPTNIDGFITYLDQIANSAE